MGQRLKMRKQQLLIISLKENLRISLAEASDLVAAEASEVVVWDSETDIAEDFNCCSRDLSEASLYPIYFIINKFII
jgi:hypothetical protein